MTKKTPLLFTALTILLCANISNATEISYDFATTSQFDDNFTTTGTTTRISYNAPAEAVRFEGFSGGERTSWVNYTGTDSDTFLTETIVADFSTSRALTNSGQFGMGIVTRVQAGGDGISLRFIPTSITTGRLIMSYGADSAPFANGTDFYDSGITATTFTNAMTSISDTITLTLIQTAGADPTFRAIASTVSGILIDSGVQTLTGTDVYNTAGQIGAFFRENGATAINIDMLGYSAIPEASTMAYTCTMALLFVSVLTRRKVA